MEKSYEIEIIEKLLLNEPVNIEDDNLAVDVLNEIASMQLSKVIELVLESELPAPEISAANISQFSQFMDINTVIRTVIDSGYENISFVDLGYFLTGKKSDMAKRKYGENHYKLAAQLGFVTVNEPHEATWLGKAYRTIDDEELQKQILYKLSIRVPLIQRIIKEAANDVVSASDIMLEYLSESTMCRRRSNIRKMLTQMRGIADKDETKKIFENVRW